MAGCCCHTTPSSPGVSLLRGGLILPRIQLHLVDARMPFCWCLAFYGLSAFYWCFAKRVFYTGCLLWLSAFYWCFAPKTDCLLHWLSFYGLSAFLLVFYTYNYRYRGRGHFLDPPTVSMSDDIWEVALPQKMQSGKSGHDVCLSVHVMKFSRGAEMVRILLALIQGAGGMQMIDPLYQRILVRECKYRKIPVIFDEVFTGFWRLGRESAAEMLYCQPDIACFAKLMTGGIIPLAVTLASDAVFEAFTGDSKLKALLHGHSYSAHAMGCARLLTLVSQISLLPAVHRVVALGTLCAIELLAEGSNAGYASMYASSLLKNLREDGIYMRPLGNVIYMMCGPCTSPDICRSLLEKVYDRIQEFGLQKDESAVFAA
ncbi:Bifunctional dethiobiotin synthetase/7,8-diamino-pelargonic acid aminotransferase, mitochondrial [Sesamum angolense]|uniref:Bifunctional dethiobiotin synthetase/7,8-diamino-pelargonic acid aminotransferase, mitochondrial n=1 Tax=Sesamum angolense TaxID=2727404 RepID=A0AAE1X3H2_9LAMI|nr:Bifunctional dethiobiotin synthetase/7,8-diamino-pelargonic acid aminotransferase, mitochondrial [Sesamum angolense]